MKTYKHLTKEERCLIYFLWNKEKYSMNKIAKILNKNKSTISRELKRNTSFFPPPPRHPQMCIRDRYLDESIARFERYKEEIV
ncbi:helix-turn-helix domain-containing protein [Malacoplasma iowae]|uniref:helix-turn-helix domain-containing protein n=1 Tax=Malacoplasma iowae TaxID=2116 RepID=UPI0038736EC2|nr:helix-turn-helix domain-containing protein [Malacoplasma iowae]